MITVRHRFSLTLRRRARVLSVLGVLLSCAGTAAVSAEPANANVYGVVACDNAPDSANLSWGGASQGEVTAYAACPSGGQHDRGLVARPNYPGRNVSGWATLTFPAPPGTSIVGLDMYGCFFAETPGWTVALQTPSLVLASGRAGGCGWFHWNVSAAPQIQWIVRCDSPSGCDDDTTTGVRIQQVSVTLEDDNNPAITNGGDLWGAAGWHRLDPGADVTFDAADPSGISRAQLLVDGQLRSSDDRWDNACNNARAKPCADLGGGRFPVHNDGIADGQHTLTLDAWDTAGNLSAVSTNVLVDNTAPPPPGDIAEIKPAGGAWTPQNDFSVQVRLPEEPANEAPIDTALVRLCRVDDPNTCATAAFEPHSVPSDQQTVTISALSAPAPGDWTAQVVLEDAAGNANKHAFDHSTQLRFDPDPPSVNIDARDPQDPQRLSVSAADSVSGIADGQIELAPHGTDKWRSLDTVVGKRALVGEIDDTALPRGVYDERAWVKDAAGNIAMDKKSSAVPIPLRFETKLSAGFAVKHTVRKGHRRVTRVRLVSSRKLRYRHHADLQGRLVTPDGQPLAGARVIVTATPAATGAQAEPVGAVTTDKDGRFTYRTVAQESRQLTFSYEGNSIRQPAKASVGLSVPAASSIHVSGRSLLNGDTAVFHGRLRGDHVPPGGKLVALEAWVRGVWQPIANVRTDARGSWRASHTFTTVGGRARFRFRLSIPHDALYPFAAGASRPVDVIVRGL
jgi:hypothetical protein